MISMDLKERISIPTVVVIIALLIIGLYALTEVNYFSYKNVVEPKEINAPVVIIPSIGVHERINNVSISQGVFIDESSSYIPTKGDVVLYGHRTLQGSPFLRLDALGKGDLITIEWPDIGEVNYTVNESKIVPETYDFNSVESPKDAGLNEQRLFLITCNPIGSTSQRLIVTADYNSTSPVNQTVIEENPQAHWAWYFTLGFLALGLIITYFTPKNERITILIAVIAITLVLVYYCIFPVSSQVWADKVGWLNALMGAS